MYHVVANIDNQFKNANEALAAYIGVPMEPTVPETRALGEDKTTPRICVCERLEDCFTAIGLLGRFRRCLAANEDAKSYETKGLEVYPILILNFADDLPYYTPTEAEVPDSPFTHEKWLLQAAVPKAVRLMWLHPRSIVWGDYNEAFREYSCEYVTFVPEQALGDRIHPWLTGTGHVLESSLMEDEYSEQEPTWPYTPGKTMPRDIIRKLNTSRMASCG